jgi:hypothetical protein
VLGVDLDDVPDDIRSLLWDLNGKKGQPGPNWAKREVIGSKTSGIADKNEAPRHTIGAGKAVTVDVTIAATDAARQWDGWGTALKPAHEPIVLARKPLINTVAYCVLNYGTGGLNIDATRIGEGTGEMKTVQYPDMRGNNYNNATGTVEYSVTSQGRWPSNVLLDEHTAELLNEQVPEVARFFYCAKPSTAERDAGLHELDNHETPGVLRGRLDGSLGNDQPTAPRKNFHPTVKPIALMRYLCRLVTPPHGTILEPFTGSGTTIAAAVFEGFNVIGCEMTDEYLPIITARARWAQTTNPDNPNTKPPKTTDTTPTLF